MFISIRTWQADVRPYFPRSLNIGSDGEGFKQGLF